MNISTFFVLFVVVNQSYYSHEARILGVVPMPSYSHQVVFQPIWRELSLRGHQVTVLTTHPINDPSLTNLTEIDLHKVNDVWITNSSRIIRSYKNSFFKFYHAFRGLLIDVVEEELNHPQVKDLIRNKDEHFDLVMIEFFLPSMYAFKERFKCPFIGITSLDASPLGHELVGNPAHPVIYPDFLLPFHGKLNFVERSVSVFYQLYLKYFAYYYGNAQSDALIKKYFGPEYPTVSELQKKIDLLFINVNSALHDVRPLGPSTIKIGGGLHIAPKKPLPKNLQKYLDNAKNGVIYFSLGSNMKSTFISDTTRKIIMEVLSKLPYNVLWKFEDDTLKDVPKNVKIYKWLPQQDVLRHPSIKLFITQGGLQSIEEAIHSLVPMIGIPFFADQDSNVKKMVSKGMGLALKHQTLQAEEFMNAILDVIQNPKYRNNVRKIAELTRDEPMSGLKKAVWWTEYALRHKNLNHLRNPVIDIPLYQYLLLDVIIFLLSIVTVIIFIIYKLIKFILKLFLSLISNKKIKTQ